MEIYECSDFVYFDSPKRTILMGGEYMNGLSKYLTQNVCKESIKDYYLLEALDEYKERLKDNKKNIKYIEQFYKYCSRNYNGIKMSEINDRIFTEYLLVYLSKVATCLTQQNAKLIMDELYFFLHNPRYKSKNNNSFDKIYKELKLDFPRIMQLKKEFKSYSGYPLLSYDPMIISLEHYKKRKMGKNKKINYKDKFTNLSPVLEQGYYEVIDIFGNNVVILKKILNKEMYLKLMVNRNIIANIKTGDIINMRVSRKLFFSTWDIEDVKGCYLKQAKQYLN